jgi:hypothetical protein
MDGQAIDVHGRIAFSNANCADARPAIDRAVAGWLKAHAL